MVYAAGILVSFWRWWACCWGCAAAGATLGWGFQFQSPVFLALIAGCSSSWPVAGGQFEIGLTLTSAAGSLAAKHGYTAAFSPASGRRRGHALHRAFMWSGRRYALSASPAVTFAVFTALALGLAARMWR